MAVVEGVGGVPVVLHILQPGVLIPVPRAPVRLRAAGEVGVLQRRFLKILLLLLKLNSKAKIQQIVKNYKVKR